MTLPEGPMQADRLITMSGDRDDRVIWLFGGGLAGLLAWSRLFESLAAGERVEDLTTLIDPGCGISSVILSSREEDVRRKKHNAVCILPGAGGAEVRWCGNAGVWTDCAELADTLLTGGDKQVLASGAGDDAEVHLERWDQPWG